MLLPASSRVVFDHYLTLLDHWNQTHALTSLAPADRYEELILDASMLLPHLELVRTGAHVVDFGSGAGIPAIVLAILRPDLRIT
ncbi:MAG: RsmG family class I SAM-dependent methyltransferase, partial [Holophagaceae bacterium]